MELEASEVQAEHNGVFYPHPPSYPHVAQHGGEETWGSRMAGVFLEGIQFSEGP